jgi:MFS family permease
MIAGFIADKYGRKSAIKTLSESATLDQWRQYSWPYPNPCLVYTLAFIPSCESAFGYPYHILLSGSLFFIVGSMVQTSALDLSMLLIGRFVGGIGIGILSMACPM